MHDINMTEKRCGHCKEVKPISCYYAYNKRLQAYPSFCKDCGRLNNQKNRTDATRELWRRRSREPKNRWRSTRTSARYRNIDFNLSFEDYTKLVAGQVCHYCSGDLPVTRGGLDRMDNNIGYTKENCVPCCIPCNRIKGCALTYSEMRLVAEVLRAYREVVKKDVAA